MSFIEAICNEAGVPAVEPPPDADVRAIDLDITFPEGNVHLQIKCTGKRVAVASTTISWPIEQGWVEKWSKLRNPVYFVIVQVRPNGDRGWIDHENRKTVHRANAVWTRINTEALGRSIKVPLSNQFRSSTLSTWHADLNAGYGSSLR